MANYIEPFDFRTIIMNYFLGDSVLFIYALIITISGVCGYYQMSNRNYLLILLLSSLLFAAYIGEAILFVILFAFGFVGFKAFSRMFAN